MKGVKVSRSEEAWLTRLSSSCVALGPGHKHNSDDPAARRTRRSNTLTYLRSWTLLQPPHLHPEEEEGDRLIGRIITHAADEPVKTSPELQA